MMAGVASIGARFYVPKIGWTMNTDQVDAQFKSDANGLKVPQLGNAPMPRSVTGLEVRIGVKSLQWPVTRVFIAGE